MQYLTDPMARYKSRKRQTLVDPLNGFEILGYIAAGTYGRVYKARERSHPPPGRLVAIKKFKSEKTTDQQHYTGLSQSAYRELGLCRELEHPNVVGLVTTILHMKSIYLVFDYAEHDLLQLIQCHCAANSQANAGKRVPEGIGRVLHSSLIKSVLYQVCAGVAYLHANWVLHRDLKPANIMITQSGRVKVGDLGLARVFRDPLQSLYAGDKVVVTVWYRAPELLLGCRHYTPAIDTWAIGCILAEMLSLQPIFKGEEVSTAPDKQGMNFQADQVEKVIKILGTPTVHQWPLLSSTPAFWNLSNLREQKSCLNEWHGHFGRGDGDSLKLLKKFFDYNPDTRISAIGALDHSYFTNEQVEQWNTDNCFMYQPTSYPPRRVSTADSNMAAPPVKRQSSTDLKAKRMRH